MIKAEDKNLQITQKKGVFIVSQGAYAFYFSDRAKPVLKQFNGFLEGTNKADLKTG